MLWLKPANEIIAKIEQDLDELPHHRGIVVTSAGVMPTRSSALSRSDPSDVTRPSCSSRNRLTRRVAAG